MHTASSLSGSHSNATSVALLQHAAFPLVPAPCCPAFHGMLTQTAVIGCNHNQLQV